MGVVAAYLIDLVDVDYAEVGVGCGVYGDLRIQEFGHVRRRLDPVQAALPNDGVREVILAGGFAGGEVQRTTDYFFDLGGSWAVAFIVETLDDVRDVPSDVAGPRVSGNVGCVKGEVGANLFQVRLDDVGLS